MKKIITKFIHLYVALFTAIVMMLSLSSCTEKIKGEVKPLIVQEVLLEKCTTDTPLPKYPALDQNGKIILDENGTPLYNGKELMRVAVEWDKVYTKCALTHDELVDTIRKLQSTKEIETK